MSQTALDAGLARLGLDLTVPARDALLAFSDLLLKWNRTYNLTAIRDPQQALAHHILDSLAILPWVGEGPLLDVGSGGGLPGIPLAIARPALAVTLVDAVDKKTSFQRQAVIELGLGNVVALHGRVETLSGSFSQIVSRAFSDLAAFVGVTRHLLAPGGRWLAMKGHNPVAEMAALPCGVVVDAVHPLTVPGLDAERHLIVLKAAP
ncbi:MAG: 16S rRNA (guanine(527)-N(7))-methyltransferase RsmG [Azonexus sp.]|nr:16S rRNA (guanine(527)-N(7))-methyltransferase RsmG [Betaproteobacteria bacterium]MBP6035655.1 16S rRNA (guanine(527)-N(7))-methyltransferase RsmG [Azonexus sp.]MBP6906965.1 16S rRNA (guanine(527)-N(7))-methyltransferase RsmG [Azonexus sp.]